MKKFIIPLLALALTASCSKREVPGQEIPGDKVPIVLNSGVLLTKAPITSGSKFTANVAGWESEGVIDYTASSNWLAIAKDIPASETATGITLEETQHYNPQTAKTYMKAWYPALPPVTPAQPITGGQVTFTGDDFKTDGTMDVLLASEIVGSKTDAVGKNLEFKHLLSQVTFKVVASASVVTPPELRSITIYDAELPTGINLTTDELICAPAANLPVPGIDGTVIKDEAKVVGSPVMFKPFGGTPGNTFLISIVTTADFTYPDATVTIDDDKFKPGKAYEITITFKAKNEITLTATVAEWMTGSGSVTVE